MQKHHQKSSYLRAAASHILNHRASCSGCFRRMQETLCKHTGQPALTQASSWFIVLRNWLISPSTKSKSPFSISVVINYDNWVYQGFTCWKCYNS